MKIYQVGGSIRDELLGLESNDLDYTCECSSYEELKNYLIKNEYHVILEKPKFLIIRTRKNSQIIDFSVCRREGVYSDFRHPDSAEIGTLIEDLSRRDFTINSIAKDEDGSYIDLHNGVSDIKNKIIRCVGSINRLKEDGLRILRAIRLSIQLDFEIDDAIHNYILNDFENVIMSHVHNDRIKQEITKMFKYDALKTILILSKYHKLLTYLIKDRAIIFKVL